MLIFYVLGIFLLAVIVAAIGIPALVKLSWSPKASSGTPSPKPGFFSGLRNKLTIKSTPLPANKPSYTYSAFLWILLWFALYLAWPPLVKFLWKAQGLFWVIQAIYVLVVYRGRRMCYGNGKPEELWYPAMMLFTVGCLAAVVAIRGASSYPWREVAGNVTQVAVQQNTTQTRAAHQSEPATQKAAPIQTIRKVTFTVDTDHTFTVPVPVGYQLSRIDGMEKISFINIPLKGGGVGVSFTTDENQPVKITVWFEPKGKEICSL
jgi:hypothetical protein